MKCARNGKIKNVVKIVEGGCAAQGYVVTDIAIIGPSKQKRNLYVKNGKAGRKMMNENEKCCGNCVWWDDEECCKWTDEHPPITERDYVCEYWVKGADDDE